jgi:hypothetical protein
VVASAGMHEQAEAVDRLHYRPGRTGGGLRGAGNHRRQQVPVSVSHGYLRTCAVNDRGKTM